MTTDTHTLQSRLSTDLEALRSRMKDQSLTLGELKRGLRGSWLRYAVGSVSTTLLLCCDSRSVHTVRYRHLLHRRAHDDRTRALATPLYSAPAPIDCSVTSIIDWRN